MTISTTTSSSSRRRFRSANSFAYSTNGCSRVMRASTLDLFDGVLHNRVAAIATDTEREFFNSAFDFGVHMTDDDKRAKAGASNIRALSDLHAR